MESTKFSEQPTRRTGEGTGEGKNAREGENPWKIPSENGSIYIYYIIYIYMYICRDWEKSSTLLS